jgi:hypothetical protein
MVVVGVVHFWLAVPDLWKMCDLNFRRFRKIAKSNYERRHACLCVCPSAWNNPAPTDRIFVKFGISVVFENL